MKKIERLILIYDANSGVTAAVVDIMKKLLRLDGCALCNITHGILGVKQEWRNCRRELNVPVDYLHRDEVPEQLKVAARLPCVLAQVSGEPIVLLTREVLGLCEGNVADLRDRLRTYATANHLEFPSTG